MEKQANYNKEWYEKNKQYYKDYGETYKEEIAQYHKEYRKNNKEKIRERHIEKIKCYCGAIIQRGGITNHKKTKKHLQFTLGN